MKQTLLPKLLLTLALLVNMVPLYSYAQQPTTTNMMVKEQPLTPPHCKFAEGMSDFFYDENFIYFNVKKGTLEKNVRRILEMTYPNFSVLYEVNRHTVVSNTCISATTADGLLQKLIEGYEKPAPIIFGTFPNNVAGVFYITSQKLAKYFRAG